MKLQRRFVSDPRQWSRSAPLSVVGATGSGKTSLVLDFLRAQKIDALIVSLDSVAAYVGLDIGSSKPLGNDRADFRWAGLDILPIDHKMNATILKQAVLPGIGDAVNSGRPIIFVGGTHFYERFILEGPAPGEASDEDFIKEIMGEGADAVRSRLIGVDSRWESLHPNDHYRIYRYADLVLRQGLTFARLKGGSETPLFPLVETLVLDGDKSVLEGKLRHRIDEMFASGWVQEVKNLLTTFPGTSPGLQTVGYAEIVDFIGHSMGDAAQSKALKEQILIRHRQLAKQQRTWLRQMQTGTE